MVFEQLVSNLAQLGFYEFLLPWLFVFAIVYGLLVKARVFGDVTPRVSGIIALVVAFFITPYAGPWLAYYFATLSTGAAVILGAILMIILFLGIIGLTPTGWGGFKSRAMVTIIIVIIGIVLFAISTGTRFYGINLGSSTWLTIIFMAIVVIAAMAFVMYTGKPPEKKRKEEQPGIV